MEKLDIKNIALNELKAYKNNPRRISEEAINAVANSIKNFGFKVPVVVDKDNVIVAGHTRVKAAEKLGLTEVPCIVADDLTSEQIKAFRLADNKTSELSGWDFEKLDLELEEIDFDMSEFGFNINLDTENYIDDLMGGMDGASKDMNSEFFSITFTIEKEYKEKFDSFDKKELKEALIKLVSGSA